MSFDENSLALYSLPFITGLIGWITNYIAIKMLFHPRRELKLGRLRFQGVIPRRQKDIAIQLGGIVAQDLLSAEDLSQQLTSDASRQIYDAFIDDQTESFIRNKLSVIPGSSLLLRSRTLTRLKSAFADELMEQIPPLVTALTQPDQGGLDIQQWVEQKVRAFSTDRMEDMLYKILAREFRFIELLGGVLGFVIGSLQLLFILATR